MSEPVFHSNGLGEPQCTDWQPMDAPIGPALLAAGPEGWTEFSEDRWRMWRPFNWALGS